MRYLTSLIKLIVVVQCLFFMTASLSGCAARELQIAMGLKHLGLARLPLTGALVVSDSAQDRIDAPCGIGEVILPVAVVKEGAGQAMRQVTEDLIFVKDASAAIGQVDLIVEVGSPAITLTGDGVFSSRCNVSARAKLPFKAYDRNGKTILESSRESAYHGTVINASRLTRLTGDSFVRTELDGVVRDALQEVFAGMATTVTSERAVRYYVDSISQTRQSQRADLIIQVPRTSDVDNPIGVPALRRTNAYAVVIGIEQYRAGLPNASHAMHDALIVAHYLKKMMGYADDHIMTLVNEKASLSDIIKYTEEWLPNNVSPDDTVFFYYSGHGAPNHRDKQAYLVPYDGNPAFLASTGYSLNRLYDSLSKLPAREVIVALDSCFSGAGGRSVLSPGARPMGVVVENPVLQSKNLVVLAASSGEQISSTYEEQAHGLFTYFFLKGLQRDSDANGDGTVELGELYGYLKTRVQDVARKTYNNEQTPQLFASGGWAQRVRLAELHK